MKLLTFFASVILSANVFAGGGEILELSVVGNIEQVRTAFNGEKRIRAIVSGFDIYSHLDVEIFVPGFENDETQVLAKIDVRLNADGVDYQGTIKDLILSEDGTVLSYVAVASDRSGDRKCTLAINPNFKGSKSQAPTCVNVRRRGARG